MSAARTSGVSMMIASQVFSDPKVILMIIVTVILMTFVLPPTAYVVGPHQPLGPRGHCGKPLEPFSNNNPCSRCFLSSGWDTQLVR